MPSTDYASLIRNIVEGLGLPAVTVWFVRDRKKTKAIGDVAKATTGVDISKKGLDFATAAFAAERESLKRQINDCRAEIIRLDDLIVQRKAENARLKAENKQLRVRIAQREGRLDEDV